MRRKNPIRADEIVFIDEDAMAVNRIHVRDAREKSRDEFERAGREHIVAVEIRHDFAAGVRESPHNRVSLAAIRRRLDMGESWT